jgi:excisionase family DNA binding protein
MPDTHSQTPPESDDDWLKVPEAARDARVHPSTIIRKVKSGDLPAYRLKGGHTLRVRRGDVRALLVPVDPDPS